jgi:hypothetical protein
VLRLTGFNDRGEQAEGADITRSGYVQELWRAEKGSGKLIIDEVIVPLKANGDVWETIPFTFVGSTNNDPKVDDEPIYDLAALNLAHYRNSASYEDTVFWCGQVQPVITGLTQAWVDDNLQGITVGSGSVLPLPEGSGMEFLQAQPNTRQNGRNGGTGR